MENKSQTGLHEDLLLHQFTYLYTTNIAPRIEGLIASFSDKFKIETRPCVQTEYPPVYSETIICPRFNDENTTLKVTIYPRPKEEVIEIRTVDNSGNHSTEQSERIKLCDWGKAEFESILLGKVYTSFFKKKTGIKK